MNVITLLWKYFENIDDGLKKNEKESKEVKRIYNHYLDKRKEIMKNTQFKVEDVFGDLISKDSISPEQITKVNNFLAKMMWI